VVEVAAAAPGPRRPAVVVQGQRVHAGVAEPKYQLLVERMQPPDVGQDYHAWGVDEIGRGTERREPVSVAGLKDDPSSASRAARHRRHRRASAGRMAHAQVSSPLQGMDSSVPGSHPTVRAGTCSPLSGARGSAAGWLGFGDPEAACVEHPFPRWDAVGETLGARGNVGLPACNRPHHPTELQRPVSVSPATTAPRPRPIATCGPRSWWAWPAGCSTSFHLPRPGGCSIWAVGWERCSRTFTRRRQGHGSLAWIAPRRWWPWVPGTSRCWSAMRPRRGHPARSLAV
jgi:hypothetical protein